MEASSQGVGWIRADDAAARRSFAPKREQLFELLLACGAKTLLVPKAALQDDADMTWWSYRVALQRYETSGQAFVRLSSADELEEAGSLAAMGLPAESALLIQIGRAHV